MVIADLESQIEALIAEIMSSTKSVQKKLSTSTRPALKAAKGALEVHGSSEWVHWSEEFLLSLPSFQSLAASLCATLERSGARFSKACAVEAQSLVIGSLTRSTVAEAGKGVIFYGQVFKDYLSQVAAALQQRTVEFTLCRRLIGIDLACERLELAENVHMVRLNDDELTARMPPFELVQFGLVTPDLAPMNRVEVRIRRRENLLDFDILARGPTRPRVLLRDSERVQEALLLMAAEGQVELGSYLFQATDPPLGSCLPQPANYTGGGFIFPPLMLHEEELPQLQRCFSVAQKAQAFPPLKSALHRYTLACSRARSEDSLVDLVIGLESILLQGLQNELSHRFSLNGSSLAHWILGKPRKESYQLFRSAYAARSSVVHGYGRKLKSARLESLSNELRHLLAAFLTWLICDSPRYDLKPRLEADDWLRLLFESPPNI
jgi:hypothetical protein